MWCTPAWKLWRASSPNWPGYKARRPHGTVKSQTLLDLTLSWPLLQICLTIMAKDHPRLWLVALSASACCPCTTSRRRQPASSNHMQVLLYHAACTVCAITTPYCAQSTSTVRIMHNYHKWRFVRGPLYLHLLTTSLTVYDACADSQHVHMEILYSSSIYCSDHCTASRQSTRLPPQRASAPKVEWLPGDAGSDPPPAAILQDMDIVSTLDDRTLRVWQRGTGHQAHTWTCTATLEGHSGVVVCGACVQT